MSSPVLEESPAFRRGGRQTVEIGWALSSRVEARCADCGVGLPDACDDAPAAVSWPREGMAVGDALAEPFSDHPDYRPEWRL